AAVRNHDQGLALETAILKLALQPVEVGAHLRLKHRVQDHAAGPEVFADDRLDVRAEAVVDARPLLLDDLANPLFVSSVDDGPHRADGDGLDTPFAQLAHLGANFGFVERQEDLTLTVDPLGDLPAEIGPQQRFVRLHLVVEHGLAAAFAAPQRVFRTPRA